VATGAGPLPRPARQAHEQAGDADRDGHQQGAGGHRQPALKPDAKATEELRNSLRIGTLLGVQGTPATLIGNQLVPGAIPYDELEQLVKAELAKRS
jgi:protein-disulfide isomerase